MRDARRCPKCAARRIWHVAEVKDKGAMTGPFVIWRDQTALARAELCVCGACGHVEWYAAGLSPDAQADPTADHALACQVCEGLRVVVVPAYDAIGGAAYGRSHRVVSGAESVPMSVRIAGDEADGRLELQVCLDCARVSWRAPERGDMGRAGDAREPGPCAACGADDRWRIPSQDLRSIDYRGGIYTDTEQLLRSEPRAVAVRTGFFRDRSWGTLDVIVCAPCGAVTWSARGLDQLREDRAAGVRLLPVEDPQGPFR